jgi:hypothetical protein
MGRIDRRISRLEANQPEPYDEEKDRAWALSVEILEEMEGLIVDRAATPPTDPVGDALGYPYPWGAVVALAIRRVFGRHASLTGEGGTFTPEEAERLAEEWTEGWKDMLGGDDWDEVREMGPPSPSRGPGRLGYRS